LLFLEPEQEKRDEDEMRILLSPAPSQFYHSTGYFFSNIPTLNLAQLAAMVIDKNTIRIMPNQNMRLKPRHILNYIKKFQPDLVGFTNNVNADSFHILEMAQRIKQSYPELPLVVGGQFPSFYYKLFLKNGFDYVVRGEGEFTFKEMVEALQNSSNQLSKIDGLAYIKDGAIKINKDREFFKDFDLIPFPARELLAKCKPLFSAKDGNASSIEMARGCPYGCYFCSITGYWKVTCREKSNERRIAGLKLMEDVFDCVEFTVIDDSFGIKYRKTRALLKEMRDKFDFKWGCQTRTDIIVKKEDLIRLARKAGLSLALVGFESYVQDALNCVYKGTTVDINVKAAEILKENGIIILGTHIFGHPKQSKDELDKLLKFAFKYIDLFGLEMYQPFAWSKLHQDLINEGRLKFLLDKDVFTFNDYIIADGRVPKLIKKYFGVMYIKYLLNFKGFASALYSRNKLLPKIKRKHLFSVFRSKITEIIYKLQRKFKSPTTFQLDFTT